MSYTHQKCGGMVKLILTGEFIFDNVYQFYGGIYATVHLRQLCDTKRATGKNHFLL
jgi:hypothetical protein